jgi:hypothetical protein
MAQAFIIMQIGNAELDKVCESAIVPAIEACGLSAKRVDKHNEGGLLKSEIISFIQDSDIIIADLTNERPNCYLEIGYAMGVDKNRNLILTVKEDHFPESPNFRQGGPKIHFDLTGYDILAWSPDDIASFQSELEKRIRRRLLIITPSTTAETPSSWDNSWIEKNRDKASHRLNELGLSGLLEIRFAIEPPKLNKLQTELNEAARSSEIRTFGWPIGVYLGNRDEYRPRPTTEGIVADILINGDEPSYDYWTIKKAGDFYSLISLFEDKRGHKDKLFFDTRIIRITEAILYSAKLYSFLGVDSTKIIHFGVRHAGLHGRILTAASPGRYLSKAYKSIEDEIDTVISFTVQQVESDLVGIVKYITQPLFELFDFFKLGDSVLEEIINNFVRGKI